MLLRHLTCFVLIFMVMAVSWTREKVTLTNLLAKSDLIYYSPAAHGVTDLAVDLGIKQWATDPIGKDAVVTYYYAGENEQHMAVSNVPDKFAAFRNAVLELLSPLSQYVIPRSSTASFSGMTLNLNKVTRQFIDVPDTVFYDVIGTLPDSSDGMKEYHVLLDKDGLVHNIENVFTNGVRVAARVRNSKMENGNQWLLTSMNTRIPGKEADIWKIETVTYEVVEGFTLPAHYAVHYRDLHNKPVAGKDALAIDFKNYRINKGIAAAALVELKKTAAPTDTASPANSTP